MSLNTLALRAKFAMFGDTATRARVAESLVYQNPLTQRADILNPNATQTQLIAFLDHMQKLGHIFELTAVRSDHSDDNWRGTAPLYQGCHASGFAVDCWPLTMRKEGMWMDPGTHDFRQILVDARSAPFYRQTGLAGNGPSDPSNYADSAANMFAAGPDAFHDDGGPHVHFGVNLR